MEGGLVDPRLNSLARMHVRGVTDLELGWDIWNEGEKNVMEYRK